MSAAALPAAATHTGPSAGHGAWVDTPDPPGRGGAAAAVTVFDTIVMAGGFDAAANASADTFHHTPGAPSWSAGTSLPGTRVSHAMAPDSSGGVYLIGGSDAGGGDAGSVYRLNLPGGSWTAVASLPIPLFDAAATTAPDGRVWVIGGIWTDPGCGCIRESDRLFVYTPSTNSWAEREPMPTERYNLGAAFGGDGRLYAIGGRPSVASLSSLNTVEAYDPATDTWSAAAPDPQSTSDPGVTTGPDGLVYAVGGVDLNASEVTSGARVYNPATDAWASLPSAPSSRYEAPLVGAANGAMYSISGSDAGGVVSATEALIVPVNQFSATSHPFGTTPVDTTRDFTITLSRRFPIANLLVDGFELEGPSASEFSVSSETCTTKPPATPSCTVMVRFAPTTLGSKQAALVIKDWSNDAPHRVTLTGSGLATRLRVDPPSLDATVGEGKAFTAIPISATGRDLEDVTSATSFTIAPDGSCVQNVCMAASPGAHQVTAVFAGLTAHATLNATPHPPGSTGQRAAALRKCKKKHSRKTRRQCRKRAKRLPL